MPTIPGLPTRPCFYDIDLDPVTEQVNGLFWSRQGKEGDLRLTDANPTLGWQAQRITFNILLLFDFSSPSPWCNTAPPPHWAWQKCDLVKLDCWCCFCLLFLTQTLTCANDWRLPTDTSRNLISHICDWLFAIKFPTLTSYILHVKQGQLVFLTDFKGGCKIVCELYGSISIVQQSTEFWMTSG